MNKLNIEAIEASARHMQYATALQNRAEMLQKEYIETLKKSSFHWVTIKDSLPKLQGRSYLVTVETQDKSKRWVEKSYYYDRFFDAENWGRKVVAWAELPEPYNGK